MSGKKGPSHVHFFFGLPPHDAAASRFELNADYPFAGDTWHQRTVIELTSPDTMTAASYLRFGSVPEWKAVEIKYMRRSK